MSDDPVSLVKSGADAVGELQKLIECSRKQYDLPPHINLDEYEAWKQEKVNDTTQQRLLRDKYIHLEQTYTGRERYLERLSTYSATFIANKTPVSPDQCAMHGWIDTKECHIVSGTKVFRLSCQQCSCALDVPILTNVNPNFASVKRIYSIYPSLLNKNHSEVCFWHTASCHVSVCAFPLVTTSDALTLLKTQGDLLKQWGKELPLVASGYHHSKIRMLHRVIKYIEDLDVFAFPQQQITMIQETAYLLPMFGWHFMKGQNSRLVECNCCFKHVLIPNYLQINDLPPSYGTNITPFDNEPPLKPFQSTRPECIKGTFDPVNEHQSYCPWRNRVTARIHLKDSYFAPPKQPLNGCEWMLEIVCKEWFQLTSEDEKNPRHDEFRRAAEQHITTSIAKNRWMLEDLSKYALLRSRLKRGISETDDGSFAEDESIKKKGKRQELKQDSNQQNLTLQLVGDTEQELVTAPMSPSSPSPIQQPANAEDHPSSHQNLLTPTITTTALQQPHLASLGSETETSELPLESDMEITTEEFVNDITINEITSSNLGSKEDELISSTSAPFINDQEEDLDRRRDETTTEIVEEQGTKADELPLSTADATATNDNLLEDVNHTLTNTKDTFDLSISNEDMTTEMTATTTTLENELDRAEENLQQEYKDDFGLTLTGDNVSTPGSWGLMDADNMVTNLDDDTKAEVGILESVEAVKGEIVDNQQNQDKQQNEELHDIQQREPENLNLVPNDIHESKEDNVTNETDLLHDQLPSSPSKSDAKHLDQQTASDTDRSDTTNVAFEKQSDDKATEGGLENDREVHQALETNTPHADDTEVETMEHMDLDNDESHQIIEDATELDLDELDGMSPSHATESTITTGGEFQPSESTNLDESDMQLSNVTTQELGHDHVMTPVDLASEHISILQHTDNDIDSNLVVISEETQSVETDAEVIHDGIKDSKEQMYQKDEDLDINADDGNLDETIAQLDRSMEPSELDYDTEIIESKSVDESLGVLSTPSILEQEQGDVEEIEEDTGMNDHQATTENQDVLHIKDEMEDLDSKASYVDSLNNDDKDQIIEDQLEGDMNDTEKSEEPEAQKSGANISIKVTNEGDADTCHDYAQEIEELRDEDNDGTGEQATDEAHPDQLIETEEVPNTPKDNDFYNELTNNDYDNNDDSTTNQKDLDDTDLLAQDDRMEEHDLQVLDGTDNNDDIEGSLVQHSTESADTSKTTDNDLQEQADLNPLDETDNNDEVENSLEQHPTEHAHATTTTDNDSHEQPNLNPSDGIGNNDGVEDSLDQHSTESAHSTSTTNNDTPVDDTDKINNGEDSLNQHTTEPALDTMATSNNLGDQSTGDSDTHNVDGAAVQIITSEDISATVSAGTTLSAAAVTSPPQSPPTQEEGDTDLDNGTSIAPVTDENHDDTQGDNSTLQRTEALTATNISSETRKDYISTANMPLQESYDEEDIAQDDVERSLPVSEPLSPSTPQLPTASTSADQLHAETNDGDDRQIDVEEDTLAVGNEAVYDMEDLQDDNENALMNDPQNSSSSSQLLRHPTNLTDHDMMDQHDDDDQLMQYEEDNRRDDEPMLDQDDLMEE